MEMGDYLYRFSTFFPNEYSQTWLIACLNTLRIQTSEDI